MEKVTAALPRGGRGLHCHCLTAATAFTVHMCSINRKRASSWLSMDLSSNDVYVTLMMSILLFTILSPCLIYLLSLNPQFSLHILLCSVWNFFAPDSSYSVDFPLSFVS